ncbi:cytochrome o ubiquinol oxidase subunit IV [Gallaecimonas pentaromativorans]|uniref:Cytochrome bo(3) ubiquinol oxidase subunit 4 n=1 Tax=Gallaecimonas pentaromativorans TaxID=584787 RepID=A0A3N1PJX1_9GAMM|nr:cytochrome o ubiquinol oxidase subunit IV [Gallaecimonas pentaromativorans]MED5525459.1 cytochrome o ubiquinol oxidase subunit IV [Pseudomonadota bacterium]ROQ27491.1 cytochrome bo3 quinol oxidase subunit 4 [Gallaecimonas pentaromativorans]
MSAHSHTDAGASHGSFKSYFIGFILSIILTVIPFAMVMSSAASTAVTVTVMVIAGLAQVLIQLVFFLHMNSSSEQRWNVNAFVFAVIIVAILVAGSAWIFWHLYGLTMPMMGH